MADECACRSGWCASAAFRRAERTASLDGGSAPCSPHPPRGVGQQRQWQGSRQSEGGRRRVSMPAADPAPSGVDTRGGRPGQGRRGGRAETVLGQSLGSLGSSPATTLPRRRRSCPPPSHPMHEAFVSCQNFPPSQFCGPCRRISPPPLVLVRCHHGCRPFATISSSCGPRLKWAANRFAATNWASTRSIYAADSRAPPTRRMSRQPHGASACPLTGSQSGAPNPFPESRHACGGGHKRQLQ